MISTKLALNTSLFLTTIVKLTNELLPIDVTFAYFVTVTFT